MKLGISSWLFEKENLNRILPILTKYGFNTIELFTAHYWGLNSFQLNSLSREVSKSSIQIWSLHAPGGSLYPESCAKEYISNLKRAIEIAKVFNAQIIVIHLGDIIKNENLRGYHLKQTKEGLKEVLECCAKMEIQLAIENGLPSVIGDNIKELIDIVENFSSEYCGICLDTSHAEITEKDLYASLRSCQGKLITTHISDNDVRDRSNYWSKGHYDKNGSDYCGEHLIPGKGNINWPLFITTLKEINYTGPLILEIFEVPRPFDVNEVLKKTMESCRRVGIL